MTTKLMRDSLRPLYRVKQDAHLGLLLQRGLTEHDEGNQTAKTKHIERVCQSTAGEFYKRTYNRWKQATADINRFRRVFLKLETRLFIGLTGGGMLETGCAISHSHGMPYIPGSSVKGVVNAFVRERLGTGGDDIREELFGAPATKDQPAGLSGLITFHDAWWIPGSAHCPLVQEVVTSHHLEYYGTEGATLATDFDSPVPNAQVAVQGDFLFVLEGPLAWLELAEEMLTDALSTHGVGAKTRAGYGLFREDAERREQEEKERREQEKAEKEAQKEAEERRRKEEERQRREKLSEGGRWIEDLAHQLERFKAEGDQHRRIGIRRQVVEAANRLTGGHFQWTDAEERETAAKALEECYDVIGWHDPGRNRRQRERQEKKRRADIEKIRQGDEQSSRPA